MRKTVWILLLLVMVLHQDWWWWDRIDPLVFGFVPIGLAYHAVVSVAAAIVWALAVRHCWPDHVELWGERAAESPSPPAGPKP